MMMEIDHRPDPQALALLLRGAEALAASMGQPRGREGKQALSALTRAVESLRMAQAHAERM